MHELHIRGRGGYPVDLLDHDDLADDGTHEGVFVVAAVRLAWQTGRIVTPVIIC